MTTNTLKPLKLCKTHERTMCGYRESTPHVNPESNCEYVDVFLLSDLEKLIEERIRECKKYGIDDGHIQLASILFALKGTTMNKPTPIKFAYMGNRGGKSFFQAMKIIQICIEKGGNEIRLVNWTNEELLDLKSSHDELQLILQILRGGTHG